MEQNYVTVTLCIEIPVVRHNYMTTHCRRCFATGLRLVSGQWSLPRDNVLVSKSKAARASEIEENKREMLLVAFILFYFRRADGFKLRSHRIERCARTAR